MVMSLSRVLWKVRSKAPTVTASVQGTVSVTGEGYTTIRDSTHDRRTAGFDFRTVDDHPDAGGHGATDQSGHLEGDVVRDLDGGLFWYDGVTAH